MFTGIVEQMGLVSSVVEHDGGRRLVLKSKDFEEIAVGASISVNGVCLTAVETDGDQVSVDVIPETLARTNLGSLETGAHVNLERPMLASGRFDGHIVQGHVDGTGVVRAVIDDETGNRIDVEVDTILMVYLVEKGSITVDGVSLTVAGVSDSSFTVALIPHTVEITTLGSLEQGDIVNLEMDVLAKYVERILSVRE